MKKNNLLGVFMLSLYFLFPGTISVQAEPASYNDLTGVAKERVDSIIDEFKRHHMVFLPGLSTPGNLVAATCVLETDDDDKLGRGHDHSGEDTTYKEEHLASIILQATADGDNKYLTPILDHIIPGRIYTYKDLYTVSIAPKLVTVNVTRAVKGEAARSEWNLDPAFIQDLARRLNGKVTDKGIVLP